MAEPRDDDDDALRWDGDEELGRMTSLDRAPVPGAGPVEPPRSAEERADDAPTAVDAPRDVPLAVVTGAFAVLFVAETVGWVFVLQGVQAAGLLATGSGLLDFVGGIARFLALVAAPLWFVATVQLTRPLALHRRRIRIGWLALGVGALVPWPLLFGLVR